MFATPNTWIKEFVVFANFYSEDLPSIDWFNSELDLCLTHWRNLSVTTELSNYVAGNLKMVDLVVFPNIYFFKTAC